MVFECQGTSGILYVIVAYSIVHEVVSHRPAESNYVSTDNTGGLQLCVCVYVKEKRQ